MKTMIEFLHCLSYGRMKMLKLLTGLCSKSAHAKITRKFQVGGIKRGLCHSIVGCRHVVKRQAIQIFSITLKAKNK